MRRQPEKEKAPTAATVEASSEVTQDVNQGHNMTNSIAVQTSSQPVFSFGDHQVRVVVRDGEPWFVASDVCGALDYKNTSKAVGDHLDDDERASALVPRTPNDSLGVPTNVINESGLYALVLRSRKPEARKFAKWVTSEVLPAIRKTGVYVGKPFAVNPGDVLTQDEQNTLRLMLKSAVERLPKEKQAGAMVRGWSKLKAHFGVSYREIPRQEFSEAVSIIARHTAEWEVVEEDERANTINEQVARWVKQIDSPNGAPVALFAPLVAAINRRGGGYSFPLAAAEPHDRQAPFPHSSLSAKRLLDPKNRALEMELVEALRKDGHDVEGVRVRLPAMRDALGELMGVREVLEDFRRMFRRMDGTAEAWAEQSRGLSIMFRKKLDPNDRYDRIGYPEQLGLPRPSGIQYLGAAR